MSAAVVGEPATVVDGPAVLAALLGPLFSLDVDAAAALAAAEPPAAAAASLSAAGALARHELWGVILRGEEDDVSAPPPSSAAAAAAAAPPCESAGRALPAVSHAARLVALFCAERAR